MFSICCCTWNDLNYLKILYRGIKRNTKLSYELIVHDNGSNDGTEDWLKENNIKYSRSDKNLGVAAVNFAVQLAKHKYIVDINTDMYPLPGWDIEIFKKIKYFENNKMSKFIISSRLIEPIFGNSEYVYFDVGRNYDTFNENKLLNFYLTKTKDCIKTETNQYSHPICLGKELWNEFGGVDMSYEYGIGTDHDIPACAYKIGCRNFVQLAKSNIYHFSCKTVSKLPQNRSDGQKYFRQKWGISIEEFRKRLGVAKGYKPVGENVL